MAQILPGMADIFAPVMHDSVGRLELLQGILLVCVIEPQTVAACFFVILMIGMIFMMCLVL